MPVAIAFLFWKSLGRKPQGSCSPRGRSGHLLDPFSEPLLRTFLRILFYSKSHSKTSLLRTLLRTLPQNPSPEPFPRTLPRTLLRTLCCCTLRRAPKSQGIPQQEEITWPFVTARGTATASVSLPQEHYNQLPKRKLSLRPCRCSSVNIFAFRREIWWEIWREFCRIFAEGSKIWEKISEHFFVRKFVAQKQSFVQNPLCRCATLRKSCCIHPFTT